MCIVNNGFLKTCAPVLLLILVSMATEGSKSGGIRYEKEAQQNGKVLLFRDFKRDDNTLLTFKDFIVGIRNRDVELLKAIEHILSSENDFQSYFFECPPVSNSDYESTLFEFVLVKTDFLHTMEPDVGAFQQHFKCAERSATTFPNLGRDAILIAPCPPPKNEEHRIYGHLAAFMKGVSFEEKEELWRQVGEAFEESLSKTTGPVWLSTSGAGIAWLHVRIDSYPKYYTYQKYKAAKGRPAHTFL